MAQTTNMIISKSDGWVEIASKSKMIRVKANSGNWVSWRLYYSQDNSPPENLDEGELYNGNKIIEYNSFSGVLFLRVITEAISFTIINEEDFLTYNVENKLNSDGEQIIDTSWARSKKFIQFHIEVSDETTGDPATPTAGSLEIAFKTPEANRSIAETSGIDLTLGDQIFTPDNPILADTIKITPSSLDSGVVYSVYIIAV